MTFNKQCNRTKEIFSAYQITSDTSFNFCPEKYSRFKFGSFSVAREFGHILAEKFIEEKLKKSYDGQQIVIVPSAFAHIPTASFYMKINFVNKLNLYLYQNGYPVVEETKIYRTVTYREDYGEMTAAQRYNLISGDSFYIDKKYTEGKLLIFIDDIKITGTHERIIEKMLDELNITNDSYMLYLAELTNLEIPPNIENLLNFYYVKGLDEINEIIQNDEFVFNSRVVKYLLNSDENAFGGFLNKQNPLFLQQLYYNAIGNEYFKFPSYLLNLKKLETQLTL